MSNHDNDTGMYFLTHILPWICLALCIITIPILIYHCRKGGQCNPNNDTDSDEDNLLGYDPNLLSDTFNGTV